jgi:hypothetical protein
MSNLYYTDPTGKQYEVDQPDPPQQPLDAVGALATLLAVEQVVSVQDAANAVGLTEEDLVNEALAWGAANP